MGIDIENDCKERRRWFYKRGNVMSNRIAILSSRLLTSSNTFVMLRSIHGVHRKRMASVTRVERIMNRKMKVRMNQHRSVFVVSSKKKVRFFFAQARKLRLE
jgi:hypothetical protein